MKVVNMGNIADAFKFDDLPATGIVIEATPKELKLLPNLAYKDVTISEHVSNAAAMREALYAITQIDTRMLKRLLRELVEADIFDGGQIRNTIHAVEKARQAIAAPPRNCDLYRTKKELDAAYEKYREYVIMSNSNPFVAKDEMMTKEDWLFAEAKGEAK